MALPFCHFTCLHSAFPCSSERGPASLIVQQVRQTAVDVEQASNQRAAGNIRRRSNGGATPLSRGQSIKTVTVILLKCVCVRRGLLQQVCARQVVDMTVRFGHLENPDLKQVSAT